ncbi:polysaccharide lyase family 7 protein [Vibrio sp. WXL103]|uniref:polysaccharide lyase family 7 protein n=1 Tax=Vibrio sp. WXL103 TaxID=3450710 RepID=UPI003EC7C244
MPIITRSTLALSLGMLLTGCSEDNTAPPPSIDPGDYSWDISQWKITIPASKDDWYGSGGTSAAELEPYHCASSKDVLDNDSVIFHQPHSISFFDVQNERMHFRANMGFGTTTANSSYIRSELRELFNAQKLASCSTSTAATSWFIQDTATNTDSHQLEATLRVEKYPSISGQDPKVIVGQVHGWKIKQALVKVLWEGDHKPVRVILNKDFYHDNQSCEAGTPKYPECENWSFSVNMGYYPAGSDWQYLIHVDEQGINLETQYPDGTNHFQHYLEWGVPYPHTNNGTVTLAPEWAGTDVAYYFKAGIYPQFRPDPAHAGKTFDVSFAGLTITHK